jgi:two-component system CheB/CheR fusion protein
VATRDNAREDEPAAAARRALLERIRRRLFTATGVDFRQYKASTIERRVERRMAVHRLSALEDYARRIEDDPHEVDALFKDVLILTTEFFRDPDAFEALRTTVFPRLLAAHAGFEPLRLWSAGCSTGEEAYSLAMLLLEYFDEHAPGMPIVVFATDVSEPALDHARAGLYPARIAGAVSAARLGRFFTRTEHGYRIRSAVRDLCLFARHDLTSDPPFSRLDLVLCRNVLMYMGAALQAKVVATFNYALRPGGYLMLGRAETISQYPDLFRVEDGPHRIYAKASAGPAVVAAPAPPPVPPPPRPAAAGPAATDATRLVRGHRSPPAVIVDDDLEIIRFYGHTGRYLRPPAGAPTLNLLRMARESLRTGIQGAMTAARTRGTAVRSGLLRLERDGAPHGAIRVEVLPLSGDARRRFLVLFHARPPARPAARRRQRARRGPGRRR